MMRVNCWLDRDHVFYHTARFLSGLWLLHQAGEISLRFLVRRDRTPSKEPTDSVLPLEIESDGKSRRVLADFRDRSDLFSMDALTQCDVYFKRSYFAPDLPPAHARKILPLGLNFTCRTPGLTSAICRAVVPKLISSPPIFFTWLRRQIRCTTLVPSIKDLERSPSDPVRRAVIFQTRLWEDSDLDSQGAAEQVNQSRAAIVRCLRESLGSEFYGGLIPTPLARRQFPDLIAPQSGRKSRYLKIARSHLVGVYTAGLNQSTAWKFGEYLSASQCIVAEPPRNAVPKQLMEGTHYIGFSNPQECVVACRKLLDDPSLVESMRKANHAYYQQDVAPQMWVRNRLREVLSHV
jgi:hypothetical protein